LIGYAFDLISDVNAGDPVAAAVSDVYRNGAEAIMLHVERAIEWHAAFEARQQRRLGDDGVGGRAGAKHRMA
jgi:hypothetical protein